VTELSGSNRQLLKLLFQTDIERIHDNSLTILEKVGVNVQNKDAVLSLKNAGCTVSSDKKVVLIPRSLVAECLRKTTSVLKLHGRNGKHERSIGNDSVLFNPGSCAVFFSDHQTGQTRLPL
jgi:trimethylamine--corrinoid protein Co-methyltransferase